MDSTARQFIAGTCTCTVAATKPVGGMPPLLKSGSVSLLVVVVVVIVGRGCRGRRGGLLAWSRARGEVVEIVQVVVDLLAPGLAAYGAKQRKIA